MSDFQKIKFGFILNETSMFFHKKINQKGFTLIEMLIVMMVIGILTSIAVNMMFLTRERALIATLKSDLSVAYKVSFVYLIENPEGLVTHAILESNGYRRSRNVRLTISDGTSENLRIRGEHPGVRWIYEVDKNGIIFRQ